MEKSTSTGDREGTAADKDSMAHKDDKHQPAAAETPAADAPSDLVIIGNKKGPFQRFLSTPELVLEVAKNIPSREQLSKLCLVCRAFDDSFSVELFRQITFTMNPQAVPDHVIMVCQKPPAKLKHTRSISVITWGSHQEWESPLLRWYQQFLILLVPILRAAPVLRVFRWNGPAFCNTLPLLQLAASHWDQSSPNLECLKIGLVRRYGSISAFGVRRHNNNHNGSEAKKDPVLDCLIESMQIDQSAMSLRALPWHNLKALKLCNIMLTDPQYPMDIEIRASRNDFACLLARCTGLQYLYLQSSVQPKQGEFQDFDFFKNLCINYRMLGGRPLRLKVLALDYWMYLQACDEKGRTTGMKASYLRHLTETKELEELRLWFPHPTCRLAWGEISPTSMPNLKRLHIGSLDQRGYDYFLSPEMAAFIRGIHLSFNWPSICFRDYSRLPIWHESPSPSVVDLVNDQHDWALQPLGLEVNLLTWDVSRSISSAPWSQLKYLKAIVPINNAFLGRFGSILIKNMALLEALFLVLGPPPEQPSAEENHRLDDRRLQQIVLLAARNCPKLEYVCFQATGYVMPLFRNRMRSYSVTRKVVGRKKNKQKIEVVELDRAVAEKEIPEVFWPEGTRMSQFATGGPF